MMPSQEHRASRSMRRAQVPENQLPTIGANVRALRLGMGWSQRKLAVAMGLGPHNFSAVSRIEKAAPDGRRRGLSVWELDTLASIFDVPAWQLKARCVTCDGNPPIGFACLTCGARTSAGEETAIPPSEATEA
jgi:transcriptional regulator with XRE-family HTH domain